MVMISNKEVEEAIRISDEIVAECDVIRQKAIQKYKDRIQKEKWAGKTLKVRIKKERNKTWDWKLT